MTHSTLHHLALPAAILTADDERLRGSVAEARARVDALGVQLAIAQLAALFERHGSLVHCAVVDNHQDRSRSVRCNRGGSSFCPLPLFLRTPIDPDAGSPADAELVADLAFWLAGQDEQTSRLLEAVVFTRPPSGALLPSLMEQGLSPAQFAHWQRAAIAAGTAQAPSSMAEREPFPLPRAILGDEDWEAGKLIDAAAERVDELRMQLALAKLAALFDQEPGLRSLVIVAGILQGCEIHCNRGSTRRPTAPELAGFLTSGPLIQVDADAGTAADGELLNKLRLWAFVHPQSAIRLHGVLLERTASGPALAALLSQALRPDQFSLWQQAALGAASLGAPPRRPKPAL